MRHRGGGGAGGRGKRLQKRWLRENRLAKKTGNAAQRQAYEAKIARLRPQIGYGLSDRQILGAAAIMGMKEAHAPRVSRFAVQERTQMKLTGLAAIDIAEANGLLVNNYEWPLIEDARTGLDIAAARKVAAADPSLIYIDVECVGWKQAGITIETPDGINVADYFRNGEYLGADQDGVEPIFAIAADWEAANVTEWAAYLPSEGRSNA